MVVYAATAPTYRQPKRLVVAGGQPLVKVISSSVTRGWDQDLASGSVVVPYPLPDAVKHRSMIRIYMGVGSSPTLRFTGYITSINATMWPGRILLGCEDMLALAKYYRPSIGVSFAGMTDQAAVELILNEVGLPIVSGLIGGTGKTFGADDAVNPALRWERTVSALEMIQQIDGVSVYETDDGFQGIYRTYAGVDGQIHRIPLHPLPSATAAHTFEEGVDLEQGSTTIEAVVPSKVATAFGSGGLAVTLTGTNPFAVLSNPAVEFYPLLEVVDGGGLQHDLTAQANYLLQQQIANLLRIDVTFRRDDLIGAYETERVIVPHAMTDIKALVQSITTDMSAAGGFTQQLSLVSYREFNVAEDAIIDSDPFTGDDIPFDDSPFDPGILPTPVDEDAILPSFNVNQIDAETILVDGSYTSLYTVACEDTSTALTSEIVSWAWTAGGGGTPASGSEQRFTPSWTGDLAGATVTLEVTDALGNTASTPAVAISTSMGTPVRTRSLYTAETDMVAAYDGTTWRQQASADAIVVANGAYWGDGEDVLYSTDFLATAPATSTPLGGELVESLWIESDVSTTKIAVGLGNGKVFLSADSAVTWTACTTLANTTESVIQVILSREVTGQIWALQASSINLSGDDGASWSVMRAAGVGQSFIGLRLSGWRNLVSSTGGPSPLEKAEDGTPFTFTGTPPAEITGIAFNVYADEVCAISGDTPPSVWVTDAVASFNLVPAEVPDLSGFSGSAPFPRNLQQDGSIARQVYAAVGDYALKTTDFFKTDTVHVLRHVGEGGAGSGPITMIGMGELGQVVSTGTRRLYVFGSAIYKSTDDGANFTTIYSPTDSLYGANFFEVAGGQDVIVIYEQTGGGADVVKASTDGGASFSTVTAPRGGTPDPFFFVLAISATNWLLTSDVEAYQTTNGGTSWSDVSGTYAGQVFSQASSADGKIWSNQGADPAETGTKLNIDGSGLATFARGTFSNTGGAANMAISDTLALVASGGGLTYPLLYLVTGTTPALITPDPGPNFWPGADSLDGLLIVALGCTTAGPNGEIWRSTNGGSSWTQVAGPDGNLYCQFGYDQVVGVATGDPTFWAVAAGSLSNAGYCWTSTDSGVTWTQQGPLAGDLFIQALRVFAT